MKLSGNFNPKLKKISRKTFWLASAAIAFLLLSFVWFLTHFERVPHDVYTDPKAEARHNKYLAAQRLLTAVGYRLVPPPSATARLADHLPAQGALILGQARVYYMTPARSEQLLAWVEQGGYLILESGYGTSQDHLLNRLDIQVLTGKAALSPAELKKEEEEEEEREENQDEASVPAAENVKEEPPPLLAVKIPGYARTLHVAPRYNALKAGKLAPVWSSEIPERARILHVAYGRGQITVVNCFCRFTNASIDENDHAELLLALLKTYQPNGAVMWIRQLDVPSLWQWLADNAVSALISGGLLMLFWLWRIIPRFGVIPPEIALERRSLLEHLRAVGRFLWRTRSLDVLLAVARQQVFALLQRHHPGLMQLPPPQQAQEIAHQFNLSAQSIALALHHPLEQPAQFTQAIRILKQLENSLNKGKNHGIK